MKQVKWDPDTKTLTDRGGQTITWDGRSEGFDAERSAVVNREQAEHFCKVHNLYLVVGDFVPEVEGVRRGDSITVEFESEEAFRRFCEKAQKRAPKIVEPPGQAERPLQERSE